MEAVLLKIIIVGQYYWPDDFLVNDIAEDLVQRGHQVTVLTGLPDYTTNHVPKEFKGFHRRHEFHNGVEIIRVPIIARHTGFFFRVLNYLSFYINSSIYAHLIGLNADVILSYQTAPILMANAAIILKKRLHRPLFLYCLDIWPDQMKIWGVYEKSPLFKIMLRYSRFAYGSADLVGITSEPFREYLTEVDKVKSGRIIYLPQHAQRMQVKQTENHSDTVNFIFAGNIGYQQNVECILKAAAQIKTNRKFLIHLYGDGSDYQLCCNLARSLDIMDRVKFYGRVPRNVLAEVYPRMDAFLLTLCPASRIGFAANTVPAKFQSYLSAGKPVIAAIDGGAGDIIKECQCGIAVPADDEQALADAMTSFIEHPERYKSCGENGKQYFEKNYEKKIVMNKLEKILKTLICQPQE